MTDKQKVLKLKVNLFILSQRNLQLCSMHVKCVVFWDNLMEGISQRAKDLGSGLHKAAMATQITNRRGLVCSEVERCKYICLKGHPSRVWLILHKMAFFFTICRPSGGWQLPLGGNTQNDRVKDSLEELSCVRLFETPWTSLPGSTVHGISQARTLDWVAIFFSRESSWPKDQTQVSCTSCVGRQILYHCATWDAHGGQRFIYRLGNWGGRDLTKFTQNYAKPELYQKNKSNSSQFSPLSRIA